jgi:hypothetical protein
MLKTVLLKNAHVNPFNFLKKYQHCCTIVTPPSLLTTNIDGETV